MKSICVYCGSKAGNRPIYAERAVALGQRIAHEGLALIYGGGNVGLMGLAADAALAAGGEVIGVIPEQLVTWEVAHKGVSRLEVAPGPESLRFEVFCDACSPEEGAAVCEALMRLAGDGPLGRLVVLRSAEEPMSVFYFCGENLDEVTVEQPSCGILVADGTDVEA